MSTSPIDPSGELRGAGARLRALRVLPARLPDLPAVGRGDGLAARPDPPDRRRSWTARRARAAAATHLDRCLGCMACVPACPSGVRYDRLIEAARSWAEEPPAGPGPPPLPPRSRRERAAQGGDLRDVPLPAPAPAADSRRCGPPSAPGWTGARRAAGLAERLAPELGASLRVAPPPPVGRPAPGLAPRWLPGRVPAQGPRRAVVGMLTGCVQQVFFPEVNAATARVLAAEGCDVVIPRGQGCCGALSLHGGRRTEAAGFARRTIAAFERAGVDAIVVNSAGCGSAMKEYGDLLGRADGGWAARGAERSARRSATSASSWPSWRRRRPAGGAAPAAGHRRLPRRLPPRRMRSGIRRQPRELLRAHPRPGAGRARRRRRPAAARPASTTCSSRRPPASSASGRPPRCWPPGHRWSSRPTPAAACRSPPRMAAAGTGSPPADGPHRRGARRVDPRPAGHRADRQRRPPARPRPRRRRLGHAPAGRGSAPGDGRPGRCAAAGLRSASRGRARPRPRSPPGPVSQLVPASRVTVSAPPGTVTCQLARDGLRRGGTAAAAAAAATAPVPQDAGLARAALVHPHAERARGRSPGPVRRCRRPGSPPGPGPAARARSNLSSASSTRQARCGLPTMIRRPSRTAPSITARPGPSTLAGPMSTVIRPSGSARTWRDAGPGGHRERRRRPPGHASSR